MFFQEIGDSQWHKVADSESLTVLCGARPAGEAGWGRSASHVFRLEDVEPECRQLLSNEQRTLLYGEFEAVNG